MNELVEEIIVNGYLNPKEMADIIASLSTQSVIDYHEENDGDIELFHLNTGDILMELFRDKHKSAMSDYERQQEFLFFKINIRHIIHLIVFESMNESTIENKKMEISEENFTPVSLSVMMDLNDSLNNEINLSFLSHEQLYVEKLQRVYYKFNCLEFIKKNVINEEFKKNLENELNTSYHNLMESKNF